MTFSDSLVVNASGVTTTIIKGTTEYQRLVEVLLKQKAMAFIFAHCGVPVTGVYISSDGEIRPIH